MHITSERCIICRTGEVMPKKIYSNLLNLYQKLIKFSLTRFLIVGTCGFLVNFVSLAILFDHLGLPILLSQLTGAELAVLTTFTGNNYWAFRGHEHQSFKKKITKFHLSAWTGVAINSTIVVTLVHYGKVYYGISLAFGSIVALIWNFTMNSLFVFRKQKDAKTDTT